MDLGDSARLLLRLTVGGLMLLHGIAKVGKGIAPIADHLVARGLPGVLANAVFLGELLAPVLILLGIATRVGGALVAATMVVAVWLVHSDDLGRLGRAGGWSLELQALFLVGGVCIVLLGSGRYGVTRGRGSWD
jgi:putative oxidoreductase